MIQYTLHDIHKRPLFTAEIDCDEGDSDAVKKGWAAIWAVKNGKSLEKANLHKAHLRFADLCKADLSCADLSWADLRFSDLCEADLSGADVVGAKFLGADLIGATGIDRKSDIFKGALL